MDIFLINLDQSRDRLDFQHRQFQALNVQFERIKAISKSDISNEEYSAYAGSWERPLRRSEVACFLSHMKAWEKVLTRGRPALILEDDAVLSERITELLRNAQFPIGIDHITLENRARKKLVSRKPLSIEEEYKILRLYQDRTGAAAYILLPSGAHKLIEKYEKQGPALADAFICMSYDLYSCQVEPALAIQMDMCRFYGVSINAETGSSISNTIRPRDMAFGFRKYLFFKIKRLRANLRMAIRYLTVLFVAERRSIKLVKDDFFND